MEFHARNWKHLILNVIYSLFFSSMRREQVDLIFTASFSFHLFHSFLKLKTWLHENPNSIPTI